MTRAALILVFGMALVPLGDSAGKMLVDRHGVAPVFVAWSRFALGAALLLPVLLLRGQRGFGIRLLLDWRIVLRAGLIVGGIVSILTALRTAPLPDVFGAFFIGPVVSYILSAVLLGERVGPVRTMMIVAGFAGVLLIVRPGFGMTAGMGFALAAGVCYGGYLTASRWLSDAAPPQALLMTQLVLGAVLLAPFGAAALPAPTAEVALLVLASALASAAANLALVMAYRLAPATRLAPLVYFQLVAATAYGAAFWGDWPDASTAAGLALLTGSAALSLALRRA